MKERLIHIYIYIVYDVVGEIIYLDESIYDNLVGESSTMVETSVSPIEDNDLTLNTSVPYVED